MKFTAKEIKKYQDAVDKAWGLVNEHLTFEEKLTEKEKHYRGLPCQPMVEVAIEMENLFNKVLLNEGILYGEEMECKYSCYHFYNIYTKNLDYGGHFIGDTRDGDYIRMGNMGLHEEKDVVWYNRCYGLWFPCSKTKCKELEESLVLANENN